MDGGRRPDHVAGVVLKSLDGPVEIGEPIVPIGEKNNHRARSRMLVHRHGFVRSQVFLENADPLVLELQVGVRGIGDQRIGRLRRGGPCPRVNPQREQVKKLCYVDVA